MTMWTGTMCGSRLPHNTFNSNRHTNMKIISKNDSRQAGVGRRRGVVLHANSTASGNLSAWADSASQAQAGTSLPSSTNEMLKIYLVEDSPVIRENLAETLGELAEASVVGYADSEDDAKSWLANNSGAWHLAIVDLFLKRGNGFAGAEHWARADRIKGRRAIELRVSGNPRGMRAAAPMRI